MLDKKVRITLSLKEALDGFHISYVLKQRKVFRTLTEEFGLANNNILILLTIYYLEQEYLKNTDKILKGINKKGYLTYQQLYHHLSFYGNKNLYNCLFFLSDHNYLENKEVVINEQTGSRMYLGYRLSLKGRLVVKRYVEIFKSFEIINEEVMLVRKKIFKAVKSLNKKND
jgi:hypothetical protein